MSGWGLGPGSVLGGRYEVGQPLGSGAMGVVFEAVDRKTGAPVAVKVVHEAVAADPAVLERFAREATTLQRLRHPNTVTVLGFGQSDAMAPYLVMERLVGEPLSAVLDHEGVLPVSRALDLLLQVADAVAEAHGAGIVHRDLKPENIFVLQGGGRAKVLDFGVAKVLAGDGGLTQSGIVLGTPLYIAPELSLGEDPHPPGDVYSMGVVLYEMLCGHPPFYASSYVELMLMQIHEPPPPLPAAVREVVGAHVLSLLDRMLAKDPADRPADAAEVARSIRHAIRADADASAEAAAAASPRRRRGTLQGAPKPKAQVALRQAATELRQSAELRQFREMVLPEPVEATTPSPELPAAAEPSAAVDRATRPAASLPSVDDEIEGVEPLRPGIPVRAVVNDARWMVIAAGPERGVLRPLRTRDTLPVARSLDLESLDSALGPVRFRVRVEQGTITRAGHTACRVVRWENVTAWHHPRFLIRVLRDVLGADARDVDGLEYMDAGDRLVWDARSGRTRRVLGPAR